MITPTSKFPLDDVLTLRDGYKLQPAAMSMRTNLASGRQRVRRTFRTVPVTVTIQWVMDDEQLRIFENWFVSDDGAAGGSGWFTIKLRTAQGMSTQVCRFSDVYDGPSLDQTVCMWDMKATLEMANQPTYPDGYWEHPEFIQAASIIDVALNQEWPDA